MLRVQVQPVDAKALAEKIAKDLGERIEYALAGIADESEAFVKKLISVPVEHRSDGTVIRSLPGQPPRRETGLLMENVGSKVVSSGMKYSMIVYSERPSKKKPKSSIPLRLEDPDELNRPYMIRLHERLRQQMPEKLVEEMIG